MARRTSFGRDAQLTGRMLLTMFLLGLLYVVFIAVLLAAGVNLALVIVIAGALLFFQYFFSDKMALAAMRAKVVEPHEAPELHAMIERLCVQADLPKPRVAVAETSMPNAFATGRSPKKAVVCATTGLMETLEPHELEGVMAHELAHVQHRDVAVMTIASFLAMVAGLITRMGLFGFGFGGGGGRRDSGAAAFAIVLLVSIAVYVLSFLLIRALSRYREFAADRGAAIITGRPSALASALVRISGVMERVPQRDLRAAQPLNAFFILPASAKRSMLEFLSTHPPMEKRIERLQRLEQQLQGVA
jgi:heat shock protein HtpX